MIRRYPPISDDERTSGLQTCQAKAEATPPADWLITPAQYAAVVAEQAAWQQVRGAAALALARQAAASQARQLALAECGMAALHFMQVLNLAVRRGRLPAQARARYGLPVGQARLPRINTTAQALQWAERLAAGENARVAAGGVPLAWPDIGEVTAAAAALQGLEAALSTAKSAFDAAGEAVAARRPAVQTLLREVGDTVEFHLRKHDAPSRRRASREWGVLYRTVPSRPSRRVAAEG